MKPRWIYALPGAVIAVVMAMMVAIPDWTGDPVRHGEHGGEGARAVFCADEAGLDGAVSTLGDGNHALWFPGIGEDFLFAAPGQFVERDDGTATFHAIVMRVADPAMRFAAVLHLGGRVDPGDGGFPPEGSPKKHLKSTQYAPGGPVDPSTWHYYTAVEGTLDGLEKYAGARYSLVRRGPAFQVGVGASGMNLRFGASTWLTATRTAKATTGVRLPKSSEGDLNVDLAPGCASCAFAAAFDESVGIYGGDHALWMPGIGEHFAFEPGAQFVEHPGGTADLYGVLVDGDDPARRFVASLAFGGRVDPGDAGHPPAGSPHQELINAAYGPGGSVDPAAWRYYETLQGTLVGQGALDGAVVEIARRGPAFQVGMGANGKNVGYGASGWITATVVRQPAGGGSLPDVDDGDVNVDLDAACRSTCGDGVVDEGEDCDDGNLEDGDGCTALCKRESDCPLTLDYEVDGASDRIVAGQDLSEVYAAYGVHLTTYKDAAMSVPGRGIAFDSADPTGGDPDLGTPNEAYGGPGKGAGGASNVTALGNLLISAERAADGDGDGFVDDPDDDAGGALFVFRFDGPMCLIDVDVLDIERAEAPAYFHAYDVDDTLVATVEAAGLGDNSYEHLDLGACGVRTLKVRLVGSGAVDNLRLCPDGACGDGNLDAGEQCDDGNLITGDGCDAECRAEQCVYTQGYWKTHHRFAKNPSQRLPWPVDEETMLCGLTWLDTLKTAPGGDAFFILAHQWIAAKLNVALGAPVPAPVAAALVEAEALLGDCAIAPADRDRATALATLLDNYNNGRVGPPHCGDTPFCGDGVVGAGETCDPAAPGAPEGCDGTCTYCGDGVVDADEQCDGGDRCLGDCTREPYCGDGAVDPGETCDPAAPDAPADCDETCTYCGDGVVDEGEECDDGEAAPGDGCSAACLDEYCGDGVVQPGEQCDDGNGENGDGCDAACRIEQGICGCLDRDGDGWQSYYGPCGEPDGSGPDKHLRWLPECLTFNDCDDEDAAVHPFAPDVAGDGVDSNCNSLTSCGALAEPGARPWSAGLLLVPFLGLSALRRRLRAEATRR